MKTRPFTLLFILSLFLSVSHASPYTVVVQVTGLKSTAGKLRCLIFNNEKGFPSSSDQSFKQFVVTISDPNEQTVTFKNIPEGTYAISIHHDENGDNKLATNWVGMPKEGVGVSIKTTKFKPSWEKSKFTLNVNRILTIPIKYL